MSATTSCSRIKPATAISAEMVEWYSLIAAWTVSPVRPNVRAKATVEADAAWLRKDDNRLAWSGQAVAAVAGRRLERGVRQHSVADS
jgi:hypothetical protein